MRTAVGLVAAGVGLAVLAAPTAMAAPDPATAKDPKAAARKALDALIERRETPIRPFVVGGTDVPDGKYPFQVALMFKGEDGELQFCGGSLIGPWQVLTAAHCADFFGEGEDQLPVEMLGVVAGRTVLSSAQGEKRDVVLVDVHPDWNPDTFVNDAAVLTLAAPIRTITPVKLVTPGTDALERPGRLATVTGWGNTILQPVGPGDGDVEFPDRMREAQVPLVSKDECETAYAEEDGTTPVDSTTMICAGRTGVDTCQGDSGGPMFFKAPGGTFLQLGITSWGYGCAATGFPGVYTRISAKEIGQFISGTRSRVRR